MEVKTICQKNKIWLENFNHKCCNITMFYSGRHLVFHLDLYLDLHIFLHIDFSCENMLHAINKFHCLHYPENTYHLSEINRSVINNENKKSLIFPNHHPNQRYGMSSRHTINKNGLFQISK